MEMSSFYKHKPYDNFVKHKYPDRTYNPDNDTLSNPGQHKPKFMTILDRAWTLYTQKEKPGITLEIQKVMDYYLPDNRYPDGRRRVKRAVKAVRMMRNPLGIEEQAIYFFMANLKLSKRWADQDKADIQKYQNTYGLPIDQNIANEFLGMGASNTSICLMWAVTLFEDVYEPTYKMRFRYYYLDYDTFKKYIDKYGKKALYTPPETNVPKYTVPLSLMSDSDHLEKILVPV